ncbi:MAG TPA: metallophosphoesterase [Terriglobia bacterium]|nr:metallophosphoesterase [Terriglobia bacterium]
MFVLAHLSDPHLSGWSVGNPVALLGKRITGYLSWQLKRSKIHRAEVLDQLVSDLKAAAPDHIAVTGDLTNISLPQEFAAAAAWLEKLGNPEDVSVIPGNHDAYVALPFDQSIGLWRGNMAGLVPGEPASLGAAEQPVNSADDFPYVRQRGPVALVGVSTAVPTMPFCAAGEIGTPQLARLAVCLEQLGKAGLFRVLMIHHPPYIDHGGRRKSLRDHAALRRVIQEKGVELVLHGHTHVAGLGKVVTPAGEAPVLGVPSASALKYGHKDAAAYHLYRIGRKADSWQLEVSVRGWDRQSAGFIEAGLMSLTISPQPS